MCGNVVGVRMMHMLAPACGSHRSMSGVPTLFMEAESLAEPGTHNSARLLGNLQDPPPISAPLTLRHRHVPPRSSILHGCRGSYSCLHSKHFTREPSLQPGMQHCVCVCIL